MNIAENVSVDDAPNEVAESGRESLALLAKGRIV